MIGQCIFAFLSLLLLSSFLLQTVGYAVNTVITKENIANVIFEWKKISAVTKEKV